jgi:hypothetical protein
MIYKTKSRHAWKTGFAVLGANLSDGYTIFWRRFHYREALGSDRTENCRYGKIEEYEAQLAEVASRPRPPPPTPTKRKKDER